MTSGSALKITAQDGYTKTLSYAQVYQGTFNVYDKTGNPATAGTQPVISLVYAIDGKDLDAATGPPLARSSILGVGRSARSSRSRQG